MMTNPQGLPPCAGPAAEVNNLGLGPVPASDDADVIFPRSVRIGDLDLGGQPDIIVTARNFRERTNVPRDDRARRVAVRNSTTATPVAPGKAGVSR